MRRAEILLVEDDPEDVELFRNALQGARMSVVLNVAEDGESAISYLRREGPFAGATRPDVVLLDLGLPKVDGRAVLRTIKSDAALKNIPVLVLSGAAADATVLETYGLGANCHIPKPMGTEQYAAVVRLIEDMWFGAARLPPRVPRLPRQAT